MKKLKPFPVIALIVMALIGWFLFSSWYGWHRMATGYEVEPEGHALFLQEELAEALGFHDFEPQWLEKAWVNGFREHTYLFVVEADNSSLREAIERGTDTDTGKLSYFSNGGYLGPSTAPRWWDTARLDSANAYFLEEGGDYWRFTWIDGRLYIVLCNF